MNAPTSGALIQPEETGMVQKKVLLLAYQCWRSKLYLAWHYSHHSYKSISEGQRPLINHYSADEYPALASG
jgi:hypothetical protein